MRQFLSLCLLLAAPALADSTPPALPSPALTSSTGILQPCDDCLPGIVNFARVTPWLWRGAQPNAEGFQALAKAGVRTVINLRMGSDNNDEPLLAGTGLRAIQIPMKAWSPSTSSLAQFLRELDKIRHDPSLAPVFVHCQQGRDRTGYSMATYRMAMEGWSAEDALQEMTNFRFNEIWVGNRSFLRHLDVPALRQQAGLQD